MSAAEQLKRKRRVGRVILEAYKRMGHRDVWGDTRDLDEIDCEKLAEAAIAEMEKINSQVMA
jgi:hypothetical protein